MESLRDIQQAAGATLAADAVPLTFGNDADAIAAAQTGAALWDRSHWGLIQVGDSDRLRFLHNQTTNTFQQRQPGQGCNTVFVTSTGRTIDLVTAYVTEDAVLLLTSPGQDGPLMEWMDRYIFFADKVKLTNLTAEMATFSLVGPESAALLQKVGLDPLVGQLDGSHRIATLGQVTVRVALGSGLALPGYTLLVTMDQAALLWQQLHEAGALPLGETAWENLRLQQGRPMARAELTEDYNPLEAGLWHTITFDKGCYIGQETIARLNTYQGVKQQLWGFRLHAAVPPGTPITVGDDKVGILTSVIATPAGAVGLGYLRTKAGGAGLAVTIGGVSAIAVDVPYLSRGYLAGKG